MTIRRGRKPAQRDPKTDPAAGDTVVDKRGIRRRVDSVVNGRIKYAHKGPEAKRWLVEQRECSLISWQRWCKDWQVNVIKRGKADTKPTAKAA